MTEQARKWYSMSDVDRLRSRRRIARKRLIRSEKELHQVASIYASCQSEVAEIDYEIARLEREQDSKKG